jgi:hypothetical protein
MDANVGSGMSAAENGQSPSGQQQSAEAMN